MLVLPQIECMLKPALFQLKALIVSYGMQQAAHADSGSTQKGDAGLRLQQAGPTSGRKRKIFHGGNQCCEAKGNAQVICHSVRVQVGGAMRNANTKSRQLDVPKNTITLG
jgi:hypothetical protein